MKRNEILVRTTAWMKLEDMLSEIFKIDKFIETESRLQDTRGWGEGVMGSYS